MGLIGMLSFFTRKGAGRMVINVPNIANVPMKIPKHNNGPYGLDNYFRSDEEAKENVYSCREDFHAVWGRESDNSKGFYFGIERPYSLSAIIDWVENVLNVRPEHRAKLYLCQQSCDELIRPQPGEKHVVFVELGDFWKAENVRRYFITVLCRVARLKWMYPLDVLLDISYCSDTRRATARFLNGCTILSGANRFSNSNWVQLLSSTNEADRLCRPSTKGELLFFNDADPVPNLDPEDRWRIIDWVREREGRGAQPFNF